MATQPRTTGYTYADLQAFPEDNFRREIIDGELIVTAASCDVAQPLYYLMTPNGEIVRQVNDGKSFDQEPSWSPDGRFILFDSDRSAGTNIWTLEVDTGELHQVTRDWGWLADWQPVPTPSP
jgi:Tol biopolymer transport system component